MKPKPTCPAAARCRTSRGAERLRRLQSTASEMFLKWGYAGVSVDSLISRVGGSRRNVYGPYGGKEGLFVEAVRNMCEEISAQLAGLPMADADARAGLLLYGRRLLELVLQPRMLAMHRLMVSEGQRFPEQARSLCETGRDSAAAALGQWMAVRQQRGELRPDTPAVDLAQHFISLVVTGPQVQALVGELPAGWVNTGMAQHVDATVHLFLRGAFAEPASTSPTTSKKTTPRETHP